MWYMVDVIVLIGPLGYVEREQCTWGFEFVLRCCHILQYCLKPIVVQFGLVFTAFREVGIEQAAVNSHSGRT